jgi:hypothetical protein
MVQYKQKTVSGIVSPDQHKNRQKSKSSDSAYDAILLFTSALPSATINFSGFVERSVNVAYNCVQ